MMKKRRIYLALSVVFFIGFLICGGMILKNHLSKSSAEEKFVQMAKETNTKPKDTIKEEPPVEEVDILKERGITIPAKTLDCTAFQKENKEHGGINKPAVFGGERHQKMIGVREKLGNEGEEIHCADRAFV